MPANVPGATAEAPFPRVARLSVAAAECPRWRESKSGLAAGAGARSASGLLGRAFRHIVAVASVELLCGRERSCAGMAPVAAGREPTMARERAGERVFGAVADGGRDPSDPVVGVAQPLGGEVHAPSRQVLGGRLPDQ